MIKAYILGLAIAYYPAQTDPYLTQNQTQKIHKNLHF